MATIRFDRVTKIYEGSGLSSPFTAVHNLCLNIHDQEFLVLVGPSGCGKTTSLRLLAGLETITSGDLYLNDQRINDRLAKDRNMAMVFQSYALYPHMTVFENMAFSLGLRSLSKAEIQQRITKVAQQLEIERLLDRKPRQLSGGQRQRVALGRAMVRNPTAFLMDEPLSNLDAQLRVQARTELSKLHQQLGTTFVYVTHDQVEAMTMGSRIAVMNQGILQQVDTPENVYHFPENRFVAGFLGNPAMNFLNASIQRSSETELNPWFVITPQFQLPLLSPEKWENTPPHQRSFSSGTAVILGLRPENFYFPGSTPSHLQTTLIHLTVTLIEPLGHEVIVYGYLKDGQTIVARLDPRFSSQALPLKIGEPLTLEFDHDRFHLFDAQTNATVYTSTRYASPVVAP